MYEKHTPRHLFTIYHVNTKWRSEAKGASVQASCRRKQGILPWPEIPGSCLFEDEISLEAKAQHFRTAKKKLTLMPWKPNKEQ